MLHLLTLVFIINYLLFITKHNSRCNAQLIPKLLQNYQVSHLFNQNIRNNRDNSNLLTSDKPSISKLTYPHYYIRNSHILYPRHQLFIRSPTKKNFKCNKTTTIAHLSAKGSRVLVTLECSESSKLGTRASRYVTTKNKLNTPGRLQLMKYNRYARKHTLHKEIK